MNSGIPDCKSSVLIDQLSYPGDDNCCMEINSDQKASFLFLVFCSEFGVFVNSAGRHSRQKPLMWSRLPLAFGEYHDPFLPEFVTFILLYM